MDNLHAYSASYMKGNIWYSAIERNGLYKYDLKKKRNEFVCFFDEEKILKKEIHRSCLAVANQLFFLPFNGKHIHIYNLDSFTMEAIEFCECVIDSFSVMNEIWMICGGNGERLFVYNTDNRKIREVSEYGDAIKKLGEHGGRRFNYYEGKIWFGCLASNQVANWDVRENKLNVYKTSIEDIFAVFPTENICWVVDRNTSNIYGWDYKEKVIVYKTDNLRITAEKEALSVSTRFYNNICSCDNKIVFMPAYTDSLVIFNKGEFTYYTIKANERYKNMPKCFGYAKNKNKVYLVPFCTDEFIEIDSNATIENTYTMSDTLYCLPLSEKKKALQRINKELGYAIENEFLGLKDYIDIVTE